MPIRALLLVLAAFLPRALVPVRQEPVVPAFVCAPCGSECHFRVAAEPGRCGTCGMELVPLASVPQVGLLLQPRSALGSSLGVLAAFADSDAVRAFTVADTSDPLRLGDALEVRPQFNFADSPALDVLVVSDAFGAWEDPMLVDWVRERAEKARFVLAIASGSAVLAEAGFLGGETVPASGFFAQNGAKVTTKVRFDGALRGRRAGKFFLARDSAAAVDAALAIVRELAGEERARATARSLGHPWPLADEAFASRK